MQNQKMGQRGPRKAKGPRMPKEKEMGQKSPQAMKWVKKNPKQHKYKINDHIELLGEEKAVDPKRRNMHGSNNTTAETTKWYSRKWLQD